MTNPLAVDLDHVLDHTRSLWEDLRGGRLFVTGGTGFVGCWLLESFAWANDRLGLGAQAVVLTRDPDAFQRKAPHLANHPAVQLQAGDVRDFAFPEGAFTHVIHAAAQSSASPAKIDPLEMFDTIVVGTRRVLEGAQKSRAQRLLFISSGAVYGRQPAERLLIAEDDRGGPDVSDPRAAYGEGKRAAELLCAIYVARHGLPATIARGFAFVGPYLPLDAHFAVGNFIRDRLRGGPIVVQGDGTPVRSYLYAADLAIWLWTILARGRAGRAYNVGSEETVTVGELARAVANVEPPTMDVVIVGQPQAGRPAERYAPSTARARDELGLRQWISLGDAIRRTLRWQRLR